jgi:hypothetical protein
MGMGGVGIRDMKLVAPAAKFAAAAAVAPDLVRYEKPEPTKLPFQVDREQARNTLALNGVRVSREFEEPPRRDENGKPIPLEYTIPQGEVGLAIYYGGSNKIEGLQRSLTRQQEENVREDFFDSEA